MPIDKRLVVNMIDTHMKTNYGFMNRMFGLHPVLDALEKFTKELGKQTSVGKEDFLKPEEEFKLISILHEPSIVSAIPVDKSFVEAMNIALWGNSHAEQFMSLCYLHRNGKLSEDNCVLADQLKSLDLLVHALDCKDGGFLNDAALDLLKADPRNAGRLVRQLQRLKAAGMIGPDHPDNTTNILMLHCTQFPASMTSALIQLKEGGIYNEAHLALLRSKPDVDLLAQVLVKAHKVVPQYEIVLAWLGESELSSKKMLNNVLKLEQVGDLNQTTLKMALQTKHLKDHVALFTDEKDRACRDYLLSKHGFHAKAPVTPPAFVQEPRRTRHYRK